VSEKTKAKLQINVLRFRCTCSKVKVSDKCNLKEMKSSHSKRLFHIMCFLCEKLKLFSHQLNSKNSDQVLLSRLHLEIGIVSCRLLQRLEWCFPFFLLKPISSRVPVSFFFPWMEQANERPLNYCWPVTVPSPGEIDNTTGERVPKSPLQIVCGFFKVPESL